MNRLFLFFTAVAVIILSPAGASQAADKPENPKPAASSKVIKQGEDLEKVLNTLNETLNENRLLKQKIEAAQKEIRTITAEGNSMRGQLRSYERDRERTRDRQERMLAETAEELAKRNQDVVKLKEVQESLQKELEQLKKQNQEAAAEKSRLEAVLKTSAIEGERDQYLKLISDAQKSNESTLEKFMATDRERESLKEALADSEFKLGNEAFRKRDFETAVAHYMKTLENRPSDPYANHNLGIIFDYYLLDKDRAIHYYRNYLSLKPVTDDANEIRERILELRLGKALVPAKPLETDYYRERHYTN